VSQGIAVDTLRNRIDSFLASRGYSAAAAPAPAPVAAAPPPAATPAPPPPAAAPPAPKAAAPAEKPAEFVCEEDVRQAVKAGRKILIGERTIVTPAARDLGEQQRVFTDEAALR
jgi:hypothetical protein